MSEFTHHPVLLDECIQALDIRPDGIYLDGTLGRAGHSREIAGRLTTGRLICVDRDQAALDAAQAVRLLNGARLGPESFAGICEALAGERSPELLELLL